MLHHHVLPLPVEDLAERLATLVGPALRRRASPRRGPARPDPRALPARAPRPPARPRRVPRRPAGRVRMRILNAGSSTLLGRARMLAHRAGEIAWEGWLATNRVEPRAWVPCPLAGSAVGVARPRRPERPAGDPGIRLLAPPAGLLDLRADRRSERFKGGRRLAKAIESPPCASSSSTTPSTDFRARPPSVRTRSGCARPTTPAPGSRPTRSASASRPQVRWQQDPSGNHVAHVTFPKGTAAARARRSWSSWPSTSGRSTRSTSSSTTAARSSRSPTRRSCAPSSSPSSTRDDPSLAGRPAPRGLPGEAAGRRARPSTLVVELNRLVNERTRYVIREEAGVWTPEETLAAGPRKLPRLGGAARGGAALPRARRPLRLRLPDPAHRRGDDPRRAARRGARRGRPARLGRGLPARRRLDRPRRHQRPALRRGAHPARLRGPPGAGRAARRDLRRGRPTSFAFAMRVGRLGHEARPTTPYSEETWQALLAGRRPGRRARSPRPGLDPHRGRRAHLQLAPPPRGAGVEHRGARPDQVGAGAGAGRRAARPAGAGRRDPAPRGQVVPGREPAALGARRGRAPRRDAASGPGAGDRAGRPPRPPPRRLARAIAARAGRPRRRGAPGLRGSLALRPGRGRPSTGSESPRGRPGRRARSGAGWPASSTTGSGTPVGWVLPLARGEAGWRTDTWEFRREALFLIPGDAPAGLRLPLKSLGGPLPPPAGARAALRRRPAHRGGRRGAPPRGGGARRAGRAAGRRRPAQAARRLPAVRTALCVEPRDGELFVFLPPLATAARLRRAGPRRRRRGPRDRPRRPARGLPAALEPRGDPLLGHARPGRARGQPPAHRERPGLRRADRAGLRRRAPRRAPLREVHARRAAGGLGRRQPHHPGRTDAAREPLRASAPTCSPAWSPSSSTTRRCRTSSPGSSSARPRRRRASTRRATTPSTSWRSRSPRLRATGASRRRPGWATGCCRNLLVDVAGNTHRAEISIDKLFDWRSAARPAGAGRAARLRDAAPPAHGGGAGHPGPRARGRLRGGALRARAGALGHRAARPLPAALLAVARLRGRPRLPRGARRRRCRARPTAPSSSCAARWSGRLAGRRRGRRGPQRARALARAGRGARAPAAPPASSTRSMERIEVRAEGLETERFDVLVNGLARPAARHRHGRRARGRRPLPGLGAAARRSSPTSASTTRCASTCATAGPGARWAPAPTTSGTRRGAATRPPPLTRFEASARRAARFTEEGPLPWPTPPGVTTAAPRVPAHPRPPALRAAIAPCPSRTRTRT